MSYDVKCYELAKEFVADSCADNAEELSAELAQEIQRAIEDFFAEKGIVL